MGERGQQEEGDGEGGKGKGEKKGQEDSQMDIRNAWVE